MTQWYYTNGRSKHGPIDEAGIRLRAQKGYVRRDTLLWHSGLSGWTRADELGFFPDDDVEPTMCAIPVSDEPPPIPRRADSPPPFSPPSPTPVSSPPPRPAPPPPSPPPPFSSSPMDEDDGETRLTECSADERSNRSWSDDRGSGREGSAAASSPPPTPASPPVAAAPVNISVNASASGIPGTVTVGNWFWTMFLMCIPLVNLILVFVWAFGEGTQPSKANWAKAILLWILVGIGLTVLFWGAILGSVVSMAR